MADTNGGFYEHFEETDPDLFAQFQTTFVEPAFDYPPDAAPRVCKRCFSLVPGTAEGREGHAAWHREVSAVLYVFGSGLRALHEPVEESFNDREARMRAEGTWEG